jgi:hypothetical protein
MTARSGMSNLIARLRSMTDAGVGQYSLVQSGGAALYWTDEQLQDRLDAHRVDLNRWILHPAPEVITGDTYDYYIGRGCLEEAASGESHWAVIDGHGNTADEEDYSVDYIGGVIRFNTDQAARLYYLRARAYQMERAAAAVWREKAAHYASAYDLHADDQTFSRSQRHSQALEQATYWERLAGGRSVRIQRGDVP